MNDQTDRVKHSPTFPSFPTNQDLNGKAIKQEETIISNDVSCDPDYLTTFTTTKSEIIIPVKPKKHGEPVGTVDVESNKKYFYN